MPERCGVINTTIPRLTMSIARQKCLFVVKSMMKLFRKRPLLIT